MDKIVMLVDDDPICNLISKKMIERISEKYTIKSYIDAKTALTDLQNTFNRVACYHILLDINMPDFNGWEFLDALEEINAIERKNLSIYVVSSSTDASDIQKAAGYKLVNDYVTKPLSLEKLKLLFGQ